MRYIQLLITTFILPLATIAQALTATQQLLRSHPAPAWFRDAKLGIFIHWGPYSVPAWSPKGVYAEWYQYWLEQKNVFGQGSYRGPEVAEFHRQKYGALSYYDLASQFKAELYDPQDWTKIITGSGAKYVVLTSKHHDGYALWPSVQANDRGFPWNSAAVGPGRDLVGELANTARSAGLKFGLYYSFYEWFHPLWLEDKPRYVRDHLHPQLKDLVTRYQPDILWCDGDWDLTPEDWGSADLLQWLYQASPVKNTVVTNDRWGKGTMKNYGGFLTAEYESALNTDQYWEECRGIGHSFGYNREEDLDDYMTDEALILTLVDVVSQGGNLLLNIGPSADGKIPVIMQQRLKALGEWLSIYGESIYGASKWLTPFQGNPAANPSKPGQKKGANYILQETLQSTDKRPYKEVFFTSKERSVYAIFPDLPSGKFVIQSFYPEHHITAQLLANQQSIPVKKLDNHRLELDLQASQSKEGIQVVKINFTLPPPGKPTLLAELDTLQARAKITITSPDTTALLFFSLDGSEPTEKSKLYKRPFWVDLPVTIKSISSHRQQHSAVESKEIAIETAAKAASPVQVQEAYRLTNNAITLETNPTSSSARALATLVDHVPAKPLLTDPQWVTYMDEDAEILVDLGQLRKIRGVRFSFLHQPNMGVFAPSQVSVEVSDNEWDFVSKKTTPVTQNISPGISEYHTPIYNTFGRYIYLRVRYFKTCPVNHPLAGKPAKLMIDELMIE